MGTASFLPMVSSAAKLSSEVFDAQFPTTGMFYGMLPEFTDTAAKPGRLVDTVAKVVAPSGPAMPS